MTWGDEERTGGDGEDRRVIYTASMREDPNGRPTASNGIAAALATAVSASIEWIRDKMIPRSAQEKPSAVAEVARDATELAVRAYAGTLEGKSLDGDLKAAQIAREYAEARRANAEADKIETEQAWMNIERTLATFAALGVAVAPIRLPDGRLGITIGDGLATQLPVDTQSLTAAGSNDEHADVEQSSESTNQHDQSGQSPPIEPV